MGIQTGPNKKEEWINQTVCQFQEPEQKLYEGQLPFSKDGTHIAEGDRCI
jgi:hypothetical protein